MELPLYLRIHRDRMNDALCGLKRRVPDEHITGALEAIEEQIGVKLSAKDLKRLLDLYPITRGLIASANPETDSEARDSLYDMIANFFVGARWPEFGDGVDMEAFLRILKNQASSMDFVNSLSFCWKKIPQNSGKSKLDYQKRDVIKTKCSCASPTCR